ncbi:hypothetical protein LGK99_04470 [Clostridium algidicarnis]|uniref:hypothetical protein n=1 Tax=Clostridium algidicarnis TaxID=37659 RepID=UPI001CF3DDCA|nr:hypothetical protein [Clostridium algidicarnis]MCB2286356.1 hypothetical protein [Clostridium algidicarnis]
MSKNITKTLAATLAATLGAGIVPVMAQTSKSLDELHKAAYTAVAVAKEDKTQKSINDARVILAEYKAAIEEQNKQGLLPQVNTFSAQLDTVQQPILSKIINAILAMDKAGTATQAEINEVRTMVEGDQAIKADDLPLVWARTYNAKVDGFQDVLINKAKAAVIKAETEKTQATVDAAKVLVADLATAVRPGIQKIAADLQTKVEAVKVYDLKVTKAEITKSYVKVTFDALTEAQRNATLDVVDNKGNKVQVEALKTVLIEEETEATFNFTTMLKDEPTGVWTVNGVKVDLNEKAFVTKVKDEKNEIKLASDLIKLLKSNKTITNIIDKNAPEYLAADKSKLETYEDVQKLIDTVNTDKAKESEVKYVVDAAKGTVTQFTNALATLNLKAVNSTWIKEYQEEIKGKELTELSKVQEIIYTKNDNMIKTEIEELKNETDDTKKAAAIEKTINLVDKFMKDDAKDVTVKADKLSELNIQSAMLRLKTSDTLTSFKAALKNLEKVVNNKKTFDYEKAVNEDLMKDYFKGDVKIAAEPKDVMPAIKVVEEKVVKSAVEKVTATASIVIIEDKTTDAEKAKFKSDILEAFKNLETVSAKADVKFDASKVDANLWDLYAKEIKKNVKEVTDVANVQNQITNVNTGIVGTLINEANEKNLLNTLKDSRLGLTNVIDKNEAAYVAELAYLNKTTDKDKLIKAIDVINSKEIILASNSVATVKDELTKIAVKTQLKEYINLTDAQKLDISELLIARIAEPETVKTPKVYTAEEVKGALTEVNLQRTNILKSINLEETQKSTMLTIAELNRISPEFKALGDVAKVTVAEKFNINRPTEIVADKTKVADFEDFTAIRTVIAKSMK